MSVSLGEYLSTCYEPDVEYVDGVLEERNVGGWLHSLTQRNLIFALGLKYPAIYAVPGLRSKTSATRYRLPDVSVLLRPPADLYLLDAAPVAIEVLSEGDTMTKTMAKLAEYEVAGVRHIWLVDPRLRTLSV